MLAPRLTVYPEFVDAPERWLDEAMRFPVLDRSDAEGLGRDDPGAVFVQRIAPGITRTGRRGRRGPPHRRTQHRLVLRRRRACRRPCVPDRRRVRAARWARCSPACSWATRSTSTRSSRCSAPADPRWRPSARSADDLRRRTVGDVVTYVRNRNINYTNVCTFKCRFCGFSKGPLSLNLRGTPYLLTLDDIQQRVLEAVDVGATEVCLQGGIHPDFDGDYYIDVATRRARRGARHPHPRLHRARGHRGRTPPRRTVGRLPASADGRRPAHAPGHGRRDPRRRGARRALPRQDHHRRVAVRAPHRPRGRPAVEHHDHVRLDRAAGALGPPHGAHAGVADARPGASPSSYPCRSCTWRRRCTCSTGPVEARRSAKPC